MAATLVRKIQSVLILRFLIAELSNDQEIQVMNTLKTSLTIFALLIATTSVMAQATKLRNICRIKGQEENTLHGIGLVVGLNGTGESNDISTMRAMNQALELLGNPVSSTGRFDPAAQEALRKMKNVAMVVVTATVPATGVRSGEKLDCHVSAVNGKSLLGGRLAFASLRGPNTQNTDVFALCQGAIQIEDPSHPTVGLIQDGCKMERDVFTEFHTKDRWVTFVLDKHHADFVVANNVTESIAQQYGDLFLDNTQQLQFVNNRNDFIQSVDATNIRVWIPESSDMVPSIADLLDIKINEVEPEARVVINPRNGSIVISGDVVIGDVIITHRNLNIEIGNNANVLPISTTQTSKPKLESLVQALSNLKVPATDKIEIIRGIHRMGKLHAKLVIL